MDIGWVRFEDIRTADNLVAGFEVEFSSSIIDGYAMINNSIMIGRSDNAESLGNTMSHGIITPRSENFQVHNIRFYNFDVSGKAAIGSCSHCFMVTSTDSGARTVQFSNLFFSSTVTKRISYQDPRRDIFYDWDGTLTGLGAKSFATPYWKHNNQTGCAFQDSMDGLICDPTTQVRKILFYNYKPDLLFKRPMKILQIDDDKYGKMSD